MKLIDRIIQSIRYVDRNEASHLFDMVFKKSGVEGLNLSIIEVLNKIGDLWESDKLSLTQLYMSGVICSEVIDSYDIETTIISSSLKIAIGVIKDVHTLGKKIIYSNLKSQGFNITDIGSRLSPEDILKIVKENDYDLLLLSALMHGSALYVKNVVELFEKNNIKIPIIVGGAPFRLDEELYKTVSADYTASGPKQLIEIIKGLKK